jgi:hypothetical protein
MILGWFNGGQLLYSGDHTFSYSDMSLDLAIELTNESITDEGVTLGVTEDLQLEWNVNPKAAVDNQAIHFTSSDDEIVTVNSDGSLNGVVPGTATITMTSDEDSSATLELTVTVENLEIEVNNSLNDDDQLRLRTTEVFELDYSVLPDDFASQVVYIESLNTNVVKITDDGDLEAVSEGTATLTIVSAVDPGAYLVLEVVVTDSEPVFEFDVSEEFDGYKIYKDTSDFTILQDVVATDYIDGDITDDIIVEDGGFDVSTLGTYTATISVTNSFGKTTTETIDITVHDDLTISWNDAPLNDNNELELKTTEEFELDYSVLPDFASQVVTITSSDPDVVAITADDDLKAESKGTATLTIVSDVDPNAYLIFRVVVTDSEPVFEFDVSEEFDGYKIYKGDEDFSILKDVTAKDYIDGDF